MTEWWVNGGGCELVFSLIVSVVSSVLGALVVWFKRKLKRLEADEERKKKRRATHFKKSQLCDKQNEYIKIITHDQTTLNPEYKDNGEELIKEYDKICETE